MTGIIYTSATEHINKHGYDVLLQPYAVKIHREVELGIFKTPIYEAMDHTVKQKSKISIAKMVELFISKSSFDIIDDHDVLDVLHHIDAYVEEVYPLKASNPAIEKYLEKILQLRSRMYFLFRRVLNKHPQWKQAYQRQVGIFQVMAELYKPLNVNIDLPETLLDELQICPTIRQNTKTPSSKNIDLTTPGQVVYDV